MKIDLNTRVVALKSADDATRLAFLDEAQTIYHSRMRAVEDALHEIVASLTPWELNRAFFARSFNGKSTITKNFAAYYPPELNPLGDAAIVQVVRVSMAGEASVGEFATRILKAVKEPFNHRWSASHLMSCAYAALSTLSVNLLIIDEFQDLANGTHRNRQALENVIKSIGEDCGCGVALFGTPEGVDIITGNPQLARRFRHEILSPWEATQDDTVHLLHNLEANLPLRKTSNIVLDPALVEKIVDLGDGVIGHIRRVVIEAARTAIQTGREVIDMKTIEAVGWIPLSARGDDTRTRLGAKLDDNGVWH